jgi:hypothetical protein
MEPKQSTATAVQSIVTEEESKSPKISHVITAVEPVSKSRPNPNLRIRIKEI